MAGTEKMIDYPRLIKTLIRHECNNGIIETKPYIDSVGKLTIGIGRNLTDNGITEEEALMLCRNDIQSACKDITMLVTEFWMLDSVRQEVLVNMMFNLGFPTLARFKLMLDAVNNKDWHEASRQMLSSRWASQTGSRATELSSAMLTGEFQKEKGE